MNSQDCSCEAPRWVTALITGAEAFLPHLVLLLCLSPGPGQSETCVLAQGYQPQSYPSPNERFGFGVPGDSEILGYDVGQLHAGWYVDWGVSPQGRRPAGLEQVQIIPLCDDALHDCGQYRTGQTERN